MPGFNIAPAENGIDHKAEFHRKHRWRFTILEDNVVSPREFLYLSKAARPSFKIEEALVHHDQEVAYFAGKQTWETIVLEFYDAIGGAGVDETISQKMWTWVTNATGITNALVDPPENYKNTLQLEMTDGAGFAEETWKLHGTWVLETNWNDLDYSSSDIQLVSVTIRFDRAELEDGVLGGQF